MMPYSKEVVPLNCCKSTSLDRHYYISFNSNTMISSTELTKVWYRSSYTWASNCVCLHSVPFSRVYLNHKSRTKQQRSGFPFEEANEYFVCGPVEPLPFVLCACDLSAHLWAYLHATFACLRAHLWAYLHATLA